MKTFSSIELLEARIAPAGVVTATLAAGQLTLAGDAAANVITVTVTAPGHLELAGFTGTTIAFNGAAAVATVAVDAALTEVLSDLGGDNDELTLAGLVLSKGIAITDTAGNNDIDLLDVDVAGTISFILGNGDDKVTFTNSLTSAKAITAALGDGANTFRLIANLTELGSLAVTGGTGIDTLRFIAGDIAIAKAFTATLGEGANVAAFGSPRLKVGGALTVSHGAHAAGVAVTNFNGGGVEVKGPALFSFVSGENNLGIVAADTIFRGPLTIQGGPDTDNFQITPGVLQALGGLNVLGGDGSNTMTLGQGTSILKSYSYTGGAGVDNVSFSGDFLTVTGAATVTLGAGADILSGAPNVAAFLGAVKISGGADADNLALSGNSLRLAKGATIDGGTEANTTQVNANQLWSSGAIAFLNGNHVAGTSQAGLAGTHLRIDKSVTATFGDGDADFTINPSAHATVKGNLTVTAPGAGMTNVNINLPVLTVTGKLAITGGSGGTSALIISTLVKLGGFQMTDGDGAATLTMNTRGSIAGLTSLDLGAGSNSIDITGGTAELTLRGGLKVLTNTGSADGESLTLQALNLIGATKITLGAAAGTVTIGDVLASAFTLDTGAGNDTINLENGAAKIVSVFTGPASFLLGAGTDTLTIGNNTALGKANFKSTVKIDGGADADIFNNNGNLFLAGQPVVTSVP